MTFVRRLPRFRHAYRELETLAARERWPRSAIEDLQLARLNELWRGAIAEVPYYRRLRARHGLPPRFESLAEFQATVPLLSKAPLRAAPRAFLAARPAPGTWRRTGGSTGTPMAVYWGRDAYREALRSRYRFYAAWGLDLFEREAYLWGHSSSFAPGLAGVVARLRQPIEDRLRNRLRLSAYHLGHDDLRSYLRRLAAFRPAMIYGYPRALYLLAREAEGVGLDYDSLRLVTLTGEPSSPAVVETLERTFRAPAAVEYGAIECGVIASEGPDRTLRVRDDRVFVETRPHGDGRLDLVVTVLNNPSFPLIRYRIEDVTDVPLERPASGFTVLHAVVGRDNDFVRTRSGRYLHAMRFDAFFKYQATGVRRFRVHQHADGSLSASIEVEGPPGAVDVTALQRRLSVLVEGYRVDVDVTDALPTTAAAKHRVVTSELPPFGDARAAVGGAR
jgi:phenylacetate-CoA ligase